MKPTQPASPAPPESQEMTAKEKAAYDAAPRRIADCRQQKGTALSLRGLGLKVLPLEICQLVNLTALDLTNNQLSALPQDFSKLVNLTTLDLSNNLLSALPQDFSKLAKLTTLFLHNNQLSFLPQDFSKLVNLTTLNLSSNQLSALPQDFSNLVKLTALFFHNNQLSFLPQDFSKLVNLTTLNLSSNPLSALPQDFSNLVNLTTLDLSYNPLSALPQDFSNLVNLTRLYLHNNELSVLPRDFSILVNLKELWLQSNRLTALPESLRDLPKLEELYLHGNPALQLSPSVLGSDPRKGQRRLVSAKSILDFYFGRRTEKNRPLNELKLILVGRGGAGKTSTVQVLQGKPFREGEESTPGIALCDWKMDGCQGAPVTAHIWDFAGQVITHALHQFFFSVRSVYVVVLTGRENSERDDAEYWLRLIKAFGTDDQGQGPPVVVALNKWDTSGCRPRLDRGALQERYPFIRSFVELDCKTGKGVARLKMALCREVNKLKWVRDPFPETWDNIRRVLSIDRKKKAHLTYAEYRALCKKHGVTDEGQQDSLAEILHNLGAALNYRNDPRLREATVLQAEWLTRNVYALMRRAEKQNGTLKQDDVDTVLKAEKDHDMRAYLARIMERFEIAYVPKAASTGVWLVPQALPDQQPKAVVAFRDAPEATRLRYTYRALPEGLVARAIVRLHEFIEESRGEKQQWASGAILIREGARALLRTEPQDRQVMITVTGPAKARQQLAGLCQAEMRDIHAEISSLDPLEETQYEGEWVATATLEVDERNGRQTGISTRDRGTVLVDPEDPNNAYSEKPARSDEVWKPTVFISYSKSNMTQRKRLESELKILKNEGLLARGWHDRMITAGDDWNEMIQHELAEANVVIILVSVEALATDYITVHEIPNALRLHKAGKMVLVPLILEKCRWEQTALGALTALPDKAKPLNKWAPQADGWNAIANGLAIVFKKLMASGGRARS